MLEFAALKLYSSLSKELTQNYWEVFFVVTFEKTTLTTAIFDKVSFILVF